MKLWFALVSLALVGCAHDAVRPLTASTTTSDQKIWIVKGADEVYRCADAGGPTEPPKAVCVRVPLVSND